MKRENEILNVVHIIFQIIYYFAMILLTLLMYIRTF